MLIIRLQRVGKKHDPSFRIVLVDSRSAASSGLAKEVLGSYSANRGQSEISGDKIKEWMAKGAKVSDVVHNLLVRNGIIPGPKKNVLPRKKKVAPEAKAPAAAPKQ